MDPYPKQQMMPMAPPPCDYTNAGVTSASATFPTLPTLAAGGAHNYTPAQSYTSYPMASGGPAQIPVQQQPATYYFNSVQPTAADNAMPQYGFTAPASGPTAAHNEPKPNDTDTRSGTYRNDISDALEFCEKSIRLAFIRKVYSLLSLQLMVTAGIIALFVFHDGVREYARGNSTFYLATYIGFVVLLFVLVCPCCGDVGRKTPGNYICLTLFTVATGLMLGVISAQFRIDVVVLAVVATVLISLGLTLFAFQTKWDFTRFNGTLFVILLVFIIFGCFTIFLRSRFPIANMIYAGIGVLLYSIYLVHDTQLMMGGKHKYALSPEEYIFATLTIYLDVVMIFLYLLSLLGSDN